MAIAPAGTPTTGTSGSSTNTFLLINLASTTVGDYNVIGLSINSTSSAGDPIPTVPTGWSVIGEKSKTGTPWHHLIVIGKFYQSGDSTNLTLGWSLTGNGSAGCAAYSGVDTTNPVLTSTEVLASSKSASNTSWDTGSITTAGSRWICAAFANRTNGTWSALTDTQRYTQITASSANIVYEDSNALLAAGTYNRTATYSASTSVGNMVIFALNPAATGTNYTANPSDSVGITDSTSYSVGYAPSLNESVGITDSTSYVANYAPGISESVGITDSVNAVLTPASSAPALVNEQSGSIASATGGTATLGTATVTGNTLLFNVQRSGGQSTGALTGVTDSAGNTWTLLTRGSVSGTSNTRNELWVCYNANSVSSISFTSATAQTSTWKLTQWTGVDKAVGLDIASPDNSATTSSTTVTTPGILVKVGDLVYASAHFSLTTAPLSSAGWNALNDFDDAVGSGRAAYQIASSATTVSATWSPLGTARAAGVLTVGLLAASGSGTNYTSSPSDSVGIIDSVSTTANVNRTVSDPVGITDTVSTSVSINITISDSVGITDSASSTKTTPVSIWIAQSAPLYVAHRGGDNDWPEMTMYAYGQADLVSKNLALNVDGWQTSDGVWVASHDQNTSRVFGSSFDIPTSTWAQISGLTTTNGGYPICRVQDVLAAYASTHVIFAENKHASSLDTSWFNLLDSYGGASNIIVKQYYTASTVATDAHARGYTTWGYYYAADLANLATTQSRWDLLGLDYTDTNAADWTNIKSYGKKVLGHVIPSIAGATQAFNEGADGIMTGKILGVVPGGIGDPVGITDTVSTAIGFNRSQADSVGVTDTVSQTLGRNNSVSDPVGITDAVGITAGYNPALSESIGITDIISATINYIINLNDSVGITDSTSPALAGSNNASLADSVGLTDSIQSVMSISRVPADPVGITDAIQAALNANRSPADPVGITDAISYVINYNVVINDSVGITDSFSGNLSGTRTSSISDPVAITDIVIYTLTRSVVVVLQANPNIGGQSFDYANVKVPPSVNARPANPVLGGESFDYDK